MEKLKYLTINFKAKGDLTYLALRKAKWPSWKLVKSVSKQFMVIQLLCLHSKHNGDYARPKHSSFWLDISRFI